MLLPKTTLKFSRVSVLFVSKNVEVQICLKFKNILIILLVAISISISFPGKKTH